MKVQTLNFASHTLNQDKMNISEVYRRLMNDEKRNALIVKDILEEVSQSSHTLVLTERREHAVLLSELLHQKKIDNLVLRGAMKAKEKADAMNKINDVQVIIATGKYIGEGFDLPRLDRLFITLPISWKGSLKQYVGRIHRESEGKREVKVYDYVDSHPMLLRMYKKREKAYVAIGYDFDNGQKELI